MSFTDEKIPEIQSPLPAPRLTVTEARSLRETESWFARNELPIFVLGVAVIAIILLAPVRRAIHGTDRPVKPESVGVKTQVLDDIPEELATKVPLLLARGMLGNLSILFCIGLSGVCVLSAVHRKRVLEFLQPTPVRVLPAVRGVDMVASIVLSLAAGSLLAQLVLPNSGLSSGEYSALSLMCASTGAFFACAGLAALAAARAGGWHGANGLLPFWTQSKLLPAKSVLNDIGLALGVFAMINGPLLLTGLLNKWLVKSWGIKPDQHSLIGELLAPQPIWVLAAFLFAATVGAAFTEEILFRGGIYNVCRRHMGRWPAAISGALIFSAVHFIHSDFLPLFAMGLIMTWLYEKTGRLVASMVFHFTNNLLSILTILALKDHLK